MSVLGENIVDVEEPEHFRKLFIGGLNRTTTDESLKAFFGQWGDVVDVVVKTDRVTGRSRGFGFITYSKSSMLEDAMANRPHEIDGHEVETTHAVPRDVTILFKPSIVWEEKKIFVSGIEEQTEEELLKHFGQYGNILNIQIIIDKGTGYHLGFGFIEFDNSDSADKAVFIKNHDVSGSKLLVKKAFSKYVPSAFRGYRGGRISSSGIRQCWLGSNYNYWGGDHFGGYGVGGWAQGWNNNWGSQATQGGWVYQGNHFRGGQFGYLCMGGPMQGYFGNNRAITYRSGYGRGSDNFHENSIGED